MKPEIITKKSFLVVGFTIRTNNKDEMNPATGKIGPLWGKVMSKDALEAIENRIDPMVVYALYTDYETGDHTGNYSYILGSKVSKFDALPADMTSITIPEQKYLVFTALGEMPQALIKMWQHIWKFFDQNDEYQRAYTAEFEAHDFSKQGEVKIHIAIK